MCDLAQSLLKPQCATVQLNFRLTPLKCLKINERKTQQCGTSRVMCQSVRQEANSGRYNTSRHKNNAIWHSFTPILPQFRLGGSLCQCYDSIMSCFPSFLHENASQQTKFAKMERERFGKRKFAY